MERVSLEEHSLAMTPAAGPGAGAAGAGGRGKRERDGKSKPRKALTCNDQNPSSPPPSQEAYQKEKGMERVSLEEHSLAMNPVYLKIKATPW
jgi:hypothetical protein